jgi:hypothetical protein
MDRELTAIDQRTFDSRVACSDGDTGSIAPPDEPGSRIIRERGSETARSESSRRRRSSRRVQEGRPNRSGRVRPGPETQTCRRPSSLPSGSRSPISSSYLEDILEGIEFMSTAPYETVGNNDVLRPHGRRRSRGFLGRSLLPSCSSWAAASTAPPSRVRSGGGDRGRRPGRYQVDHRH